MSADRALRPLAAVCASFRCGGTAASAQDFAVAPTVEQAARTYITRNTLEAPVRFLASDALEGRGPGTRGDQLARLYLSAELEALGYQPGGPNGQWQQPFDIVGIKTSAPGTWSFQAADSRVDLKLRDDYIAASGVQSGKAAIDDAELVFVGYGIQAPRVRVGRLQGRGPARARCSSCSTTIPTGIRSCSPASAPVLRPLDLQVRERRAPRRRRRDHHPHDAVGGLSVAGGADAHGAASSSSFPRGTSRACSSRPGPRRTPRGGWSRRPVRISTSWSRRAKSRDFRPVPLGIRTSIAVSNTVTHGQTANVAGLLPGSDPKLADEVVIYSAHHDHFGIGEPDVEAATGSTTARSTTPPAVRRCWRSRARSRVARAPRRSILILFVAGEEQGLLGSVLLRGASDSSRPARSRRTSTTTAATSGAAHAM